MWDSYSYTVHVSYNKTKTKRGKVAWTYREPSVALRKGFITNIFTNQFRRDHSTTTVKSDYAISVSNLTSKAPGSGQHIVQLRNIQGASSLMAYRDLQLHIIIVVIHGLPLPQLFHGLDIPSEAIPTLPIQVFAFPKDLGIM